MLLSPDNLRRLIERHESGRFTQDSPVMPDAWLAFADPAAGAVDLLLTPAPPADPAVLAADVRDRLGEEADVWLAYSGAYVAATLSLEQLLHAVLPLSGWWRSLWKATGGKETPGAELTWLATVLGTIAALRDPDSTPTGEAVDEELHAAGAELLRPKSRLKPPKEGPTLKRVTLNRPAFRAVARSRQTVKADAVNRLFDVDCSQIAWAVIDSGIDATHPAFRRRTETGKPYQRPFEKSGKNRTRVEATYDMTLLRLAHRAAEAGDSDNLEPAVARIVAKYGDELEAIRTHLLDREPLNWDLLEPLLRVPHLPGRDGYKPPHDDHGSHVAGILAGNWPEARKWGADYELIGLCPDLRLYDLRVFPSDRDGDEFTVAAALQFVDYLNGFGRKIEIAGANLSLSVPYELSAFGCGQTPVCQETNRLVAGGVVVVAAAGNQGREEYVLEGERVQGHRMISLTDPGNAEDAITVGSTHATDPHAYGVSHFSGRGPTADGRRKPDLVAPGEKIQAPAVGRRAVSKDGTSQAAPHVSGAAALLLARHRELIGKPREVKQLLMESATDLAREPYFQGAGLVDALRATQST
jgi:serine protease AprX